MVHLDSRAGGHDNSQRLLQAAIHRSVHMPCGNRGLRHVTLPVRSNRVRLIPEELPIARSGLGVLVNRHQDCADVVIAPPLMHSYSTDLRQGFEESRVVLGVRVAPFQGLNHCRPPRTLPFIGLGCSFLSRSRSAHISSILTSIRPRRTSADAEEIPALWSWMISLRCLPTWPRMRSRSERTFSIPIAHLQFPLDCAVKAVSPSL